MEYVGDPTHHELSEPLGAIAAAALFGGVIVYLAGHIGFKLRTLGVFSKPRAALVVLVGIGWALAGDVPALAQVVLLATLVWGLAVYETLHYAEERARTRHAGHGHA
jgi:hypothetical protein